MTPIRCIGDAKYATQPTKAYGAIYTLMWFQKQTRLAPEDTSRVTQPPQPGICAQSRGAFTPLRIEKVGTSRL